ncbi:ABC transporter ATP-binding protein [Nonomuraea sp. NPDC004297]
MAIRQQQERGAPVLEVRDLTVEIRTKRGTITPVDRLSFTLRGGEVLGLVGESGSGKSVSMMALMGLLPAGAARVTSGTAFLGGTDLLSVSPKRLNSMRGGVVSMVFQDPMSALNPVMRVGDQVMEAVRVHHRGLGRKGLRARAVELLELVGITDAGERMNAYPHEFSGGMRQRVMIAMAAANEPAVIIADEPTTALDVTVQAQILELLQDMKERIGSAIILITHDLGVIAEIADRVMVMYAGGKVEEAAVQPIFDAPRHPYTASLLASMPKLSGEVTTMRTIPGAPPDLLALPQGCRFNPRCPLADGRTECHTRAPELVQVGGGQQSACHFPAEVEKAFSRSSDQIEEGGERA